SPFDCLARAGIARHSRSGPVRNRTSPRSFRFGLPCTLFTDVGGLGHRTSPSTLGQVYLGVIAGHSRPRGARRLRPVLGAGRESFAGGGTRGITLRPLEANDPPVRSANDLDAAFDDPVGSNPWARPRWCSRPVRCDSSHGTRVHDVGPVRESMFG